MIAGSRVHLMAPAIRMDEFQATLLKEINAGRIRAYLSPSADSGAGTHPGFDDDEKARRSIIACIKGKPPA